MLDLEFFFFKFTIIDARIKVKEQELNSEWTASRIERLLGLDDVVVVAQIGKISDAVKLNVLTIPVDKVNYQRVVVDTIVQQHVALVRLSNVKCDIDKTVIE